MMNEPLGDIEASFSQIPACLVSGSLTDDQNESTLRIRYCRDQGLVELRRYVGGADGKVWTKKCMTSVLNLEEISQIELARLDEAEKDGLTRLIKFSQACKTIEELGLLDQVSGGQRLPEPLYAKFGGNYNPPLDTLALDMPLRPSKLSSTLSRKILTT